jgi:hypothetical protein
MVLSSCKDLGYSATRYVLCKPVFIIKIMNNIELETIPFNQNIDLDSSKPRVDIHLRAFCDMFDKY